MMAAVIAAMSLGELLGPAAGDFSELVVTDLASDSRSVTPGAAFVAVEGLTGHGLDYAAAALAAGASIVIYDPPATPRAVPQPALGVPGLAKRVGELGRRFYGREHAPDQLIGVTGTNGKTTVAWLVARALTALGDRCAYLGTLGYGDPDSLRPQALTTPDCLTLHRELAEIGRGTKAIEVSSHAIDQDRIAGLGFGIAAFTNLSHDHLDWHGTIDAYFASKRRLFERDELAVAVVNADDAHGRSLLDQLRPEIDAISVTADANRQATLRAGVVNRGLDGLELRIRAEGASATIETPLIGSFNAENLLVALGVLVGRGHALAPAAEALSGAAPPPGRMETFGGPPDLPRVIVDYAHTPAALDRALAEIAALRPGQLICVFGCGGDRDRDKRPDMGAAAARHADQIIITDDNPRSEDPEAIVTGITAGIGAAAKVRVEHDRFAAIAAAIGLAGPEDVVVVAGKGHETRQLVGATARPFDDRDAVRRILEGRS